jgi:cytochrome c oxidase accessory protein FixG
LAHIGKTQPEQAEEQDSDGFLQYFEDHHKVYPKAVRGKVRSVKWAVLIFCLTVYYALPWLRWDRGAGEPNQALLLDIYDRRFYFFNLEFWPQDIYYLTGLLILAALGLFLVTSLFGRVWCGFACPQTVWTDLFLLVERIIEGDRNKRMRRDYNKLTFDTVWRKTAKHAVWLGIAFWTGGAWIMYYLDAPSIVGRFWRGEAGTPVYAFTFLFTATTYLLAGWAREQVCTFMCPWPRFQSAMLDEQSFVVTYQGWRGEKRGHMKLQRTAAARGETYGDCIDCGNCVTACPMGIDIRDGIQLPCIGCGLCIDACNAVMTKVRRPTGLIKWDTLERQNASGHGAGMSAHLLRPRTIIYVTAMLAATTVMVVAMANRATIDLAVLQDRAPLFVRIADGSIRDGYTVKVTNKTHEAAVFDLGMAGLDDGRMAFAERHQDRENVLHLPVGPDTVGAFRVLVMAQDHGASTKFDFTLRNTATGESTVYHAVFLGPEAAADRGVH